MQAEDDPSVPSSELSGARPGGAPLLGGATAAELIRDRVRAAILCGELLPGQAISLPKLAEAHRLQVGALAATLRSLELELLLTVRGRMAFVAPLSAGNLHASQRFGRIFSQALLPRAFELITSAHLDRVEALMRARDVEGPDYTESVLRPGALAIVTLYHPVSTPADQRELRALLEHGGRYNIFSGRYVDSLRVSHALNYAEHQYEILQLLRAGQHAAATHLQLAQVGRLHAFELLSLDYPRLTDDDSPVAEVIPLRRANLGAAPARPREPRSATRAARGRRRAQ